VPIRDYEDVTAWCYPRLAERLMSRWGQERVDEVAHMVDSPRRVIIEVTPTRRVAYDGDKMREATNEARQAGALQSEA
jgi:hypothetical protein